MSETLLICEVVGAEYTYLPLCKSLSSLILPLRNAKSAKDEAKECQEWQEVSGILAPSFFYFFDFFLLFFTF